MREDQNYTAKCQERMMYEGKLKTVDGLESTAGIGKILVSVLMVNFRLCRPKHKI